MLHPSYTEIMEKVNSDVEEGTEKVVNSRYSIVIAAAKRARQLIEAEKMDPDGAYHEKPLSTAVSEIFNGTVKIMPEEAVALEQVEMEVEAANEDL